MEDAPLPTRVDTQDLEYIPTYITLEPYGHMLLTFHKFSTFCGACFFVLFFFYVEAYWSSIGPLLYMVMMVLVYAIQRKGHLRMATVVMVYSLWIAPAWVCLFTGGRHSPISYWLLPPIILSVPIGGVAVVLCTLSTIVYSVVLNVAPMPVSEIEMDSVYFRLMSFMALSSSALMLALVMLGHGKVFHELTKRYKEVCAFFVLFFCFVLDLVVHSHPFSFALSYLPPLILVSATVEMYV